MFEKQLAAFKGTVLMLIVAPSPVCERLQVDKLKYVNNFQTHQHISNTLNIADNTVNNTVNALDSALLLPLSTAPLSASAITLTRVCVVWCN